MPPQLLLIAFAVIGILSVIAALAVYLVIKHPEPPRDFGPDSKLNT